MSKNVFKLEWGFPRGSYGKESTCNVGDLGLIPGLGRSPGEEKDYPLQYSGLENSKERGLAGYSPWGCKESDMTVTNTSTLFISQGGHAGIVIWYKIDAQ